MKSEILRLLKETEGYLSGQQLCDHFGVSRTAVWKVMGQLKKEGYEIEAVRNKGYHLVDSPDVMSRAEVESQLHTSFAGHPVFYYDELDSTNTRAKALGEAAKAHGSLVVTDHQTTGKGRRGRAWESPPGSSIYMTLLLRPDLMPAKAPMLTLVMALAVAEGIRARTGLEAVIKWPNDIVVNTKKVCGILTEMSAEIDYINYVVIGVGINANTQAFPEEIKETATSLYAEGQERVPRAKLIACILEHFEIYYETFLRRGDLSGLQVRYNELLVNKDREVRILEPKGEYNAYALGINEAGELMVKTPEGGTQAIFAGEVSVRGTYGYV